MPAKVVHCKKEKFDVYIGRGKNGKHSPWHNPFFLTDPKDDIARAKVCSDYRNWVLQQPELMNNLWRLKDKTLACWCAPRECHGDFLSYLANDIPGTLKLIIAGSRSFNDYELLKQQVDLIAKDYNDVIIICGMAPGADALGKRYADEHGYLCIPMPALWDKYKKSAGYRRNESMAKIANMVCCFWNGTSPGTRHMLDLAKKHKLDIHTVLFKELPI